MTGFDRLNRSYYLDDMKMSTGSLVRYKYNCGLGILTPGNTYTVQNNKQLIADDGQLVNPSSRFIYT